jgi:hypothetical protein
MPTYDKNLELAEVIKFDSDNIIKRVVLNVKTFDVAIGSNVFDINPMVAILTTEDKANTSIEKVSTANTATDITLWAYEYAGGDTYYNSTIKDRAEDTVANLIEFDGTSTVDISTLS